MSMWSFFAITFYSPGYITTIKQGPHTYLCPVRGCMWRVSSVYYHVLPCTTMYFVQMTFLILVTNVKPTREQTGSLDQNGGWPARRGRGTPPTKMVFLGSRGWEPSITKSLSFRFHGRIWTCWTGHTNRTLSAYIYIFFIVFKCYLGEKDSGSTTILNHEGQVCSDWLKLVNYVTWH